MSRPPIERSVAGVPQVTLFKPAGVPARELEQLQLPVDQLEAIRLVDLEGLSHEQAAAVIGVSRQTVGRLLDAGRGTVADALTRGKAIVIGGGQYRVEGQRLRCRVCDARWEGTPGEIADVRCPKCGATDVGVCWGPGWRCAGRRGRGVEADVPRGPGGGGRRGGGGGRRHGWAHNA